MYEHRDLNPLQIHKNQIKMNILHMLKTKTGTQSPSFLFYLIHKLIFRV